MGDSWAHCLESSSKSSWWPVELPYGHQRAHQYSILCIWLSSGNLTQYSQVPGESTLLTSALGVQGPGKPQKEQTGKVWLFSVLPLITSEGVCVE